MLSAHLSLDSIYAQAVEVSTRKINRGRDARADIAVSEPAPGSVLEAHRNRRVLVLLVLKRKKGQEQWRGIVWQGFPFNQVQSISPFTRELLKKNCIHICLVFLRV